MLEAFQGKNSGNIIRQATFHWLYTIPISVEPPPSTKYGAHTALSQSTSSQNTLYVRDSVLIMVVGRSKRNQRPYIRETMHSALNL